MTTHKVNNEYLHRDLIVRDAGQFELDLSTPSRLRDRGVHTFWTTPNRNSPSVVGGFQEQRIGLMVWAMSALTCSRFFQSFELYTDRLGASLARRLRLPYNVINLSLADFGGNPRLWTFSKYVTLAEQDDPYFVHIDQDVWFTKTKPIEAALGWAAHGVFCQNVDKFADMEVKAPDILAAYRNGLANGNWTMESAKERCAPFGGILNSAVFGIPVGTDQQQFNEFVALCRKAIQWAKREQGAFGPYASFALEQAYLTEVCAHLFSGMRTAVMTDDFFDRQTVVDGYVHFMAGSKNEAAVGRKIEEVAAEFYGSTFIDKINHVSKDLYESSGSNSAHSSRAV